jgi:hypothetical protein
LFLWGPEEVIYLFEAFRNPRRQIGRDIFDFFSRTAAHKVSRLARNVTLNSLNISIRKSSF